MTTKIDALRLELLDLISIPLIGRGHRGRMIRKGLHDAASALDILSAALTPFAEIALTRDCDANAPDMIDGPDLAITPSQIRAARNALSTAHGVGDD